MASNVGELEIAEADSSNGSGVVHGSIGVAAVLVVLGVIAVVLPWPLQRPMWIKAEVVLVAWWAVWATVLSSMLYRGVSLRRHPTYPAEDSTRNGSSQWSVGLEGANFGDYGDGAHVIAALVALIALLWVIWLVVDVIAPLLVPVGYAIVWWMLARVLRSSERCKGHLLRSLARGVVWASAYTLPLAIGVALVHAVI